MKVLEVNKLYSPWVGGVEKVAQDIAESLQGENFQFELLVCQPKGGAIEDNINGIPVHRAASFGMLMGMPISLDFFRKFRKLSKESDLIILHHPFPLGFFAYLLFSKKRMMVWYHSDILRQKITGFLFKPFIKIVLERAEKILVASNGLVKNSAILKPFAEKCEVIPFGEDLSAFSDGSAYISDIEALKNQFLGNLVLAVGRLVPYKGFEYLIEAMNGLDAKLLIVGEGPLREELQKKINNLGLKDQVFLVGSVNNLAPYYFASDVFVLPSVMATEAFGLVQIEAMAAGKPVINTSLPTGVPEVSLDGQTGLTVPPRDANALREAIKKLLEDEGTRKKLGSEAKLRANKEFSIEAFKNRLRCVLG